MKERRCPVRVSVLWYGRDCRNPVAWHYRCDYFSAWLCEEHAQAKKARGLSTFDGERLWPIARKAA
jgi:hypothetical protein